jgi:hypothetical protein
VRQVGGLWSSSPSPYRCTAYYRYAKMVGVLLRVAYLGVTNTFAMLRLLPMSNRDKDIEILALRRRIAVLQRQLGERKFAFEPADRGRCWPRCCTGYPQMCCVGCGCWYAQTPSCAGTAT